MDYPKCVAVLAMLGCCWGSTASFADQNSPPPRTLRRSDVVFMYDDPKQYEPYGCTVLGWAGDGRGKAYRGGPCQRGTALCHQCRLSDRVQSHDRLQPGLPRCRLPQLRRPAVRGTLAVGPEAQRPIGLVVVYQQPALPEVSRDATGGSGEGRDRMACTSTTTGAAPGRSPGSRLASAATAWRHSASTWARPCPRRSWPRWGSAISTPSTTGNSFSTRGVKPEDYQKQRASLPLAAEFLDFQVKANTAFVADYRQPGRRVGRPPVVACASTRA